MFLKLFQKICCIILQRKIEKNKNNSVEIIKLIQDKLPLKYTYYNFSGLILDGIDFKKSSLSFLNFNNITISNCNLDDCPIWGSSFQNTIIKNSTLKNTDVHMCHMSFATIEESDFSGSDFSTSKMLFSKVSRCIFEDADFKWIEAQGTVFLKNSFKNSIVSMIGRRDKKLDFDKNLIKFINCDFTSATFREGTCFNDFLFLYSTFLFTTLRNSIFNMDFVLQSLTEDDTFMVNEVMWAAIFNNSENMFLWSLKNGGEINKKNEEGMSPIEKMQELNRNQLMMLLKNKKGSNKISII